MKNNTNTTTLAEAQVLPAVDQTTQDFKNALLIVSLVVNAFILIAWITLQVTAVYDAQVAAFLFAR